MDNKQRQIRTEILNKGKQNEKEKYNKLKKIIKILIFFIMFNQIQ